MSRNNVGIYERNEDYVELREHLRGVIANARGFRLEMHVGPDLWPDDKTVETFRARAKSDGFSGRSRWISAALHQLARDTPYGVLGLCGRATAEEVRAAYLARIQEVHPDKGGSAEEAQRVNSAYDRIKGVK